MMRHIVFALLVLLLSVTALGCSTVPSSTPAADVADCTNLPSGSKIKIESPWTNATDSGEGARVPAATPMMGGSMGSSPMSGSIKTAAFMVIHNCGVQADTLVKAASNLDGTTRLMNFEMKDGKSSMVDVSQIDIPAGKRVTLKSGGYHVMFLDLKKDVRPGDSVELILTFKYAGDIKVIPTVKTPGQ